MVTTIGEQLKHAIETKHLLQLEYKNRLRIVEPHDYGIQKSTERLLAYQRGTLGAATKAEDAGWRLFNVDEIRRCAELDDTFRGSRAEGHQQHYEWDVVYARVS